MSPWGTWPSPCSPTVTRNGRRPISRRPSTGATATDPAPHAADFTATINWGDGSASDGTVKQYQNPALGFYVVGNHTYGQAGPYFVHVTIHTPGGDVTTESLALVLGWGLTG